MGAWWAWCSLVGWCSLSVTRLCTLLLTAGFSQSGVARFKSTASYSGFVYLMFASIAGVTAIVAALCLTGLLVMMIGG